MAGRTRHVSRAARRSPTLAGAIRRTAAAVATIMEVGALPPSDHRPWPPPPGPWVMAQTWRNLLFAHWPVPSRALAHLIPPGLTLQTSDRRAWVGITPFVVTGLRARATPAIRGVSEFPELNVRTYVTA